MLTTSSFLSNSKYRRQTLISPQCRSTKRFKQNSSLSLRLQIFLRNSQNQTLFALETAIHYQNLMQNNINTKGDVHKDTSFCISLYVKWQPKTLEPVSASVSNENRLPNTAHDY